MNPKRHVDKVGIAAYLRRGQKAGRGAGGNLSQPGGNSRASPSCSRIPLHPPMAAMATSLSPWSMASLRAALPSSSSSQPPHFRLPAAAPSLPSSSRLGLSRRKQLTPLRSFSGLSALNTLFSIGSGELRIYLDYAVFHPQPFFVGRISTLVFSESISVPA